MEIASISMRLYRITLVVAAVVAILGCASQATSHCMARPAANGSYGGWARFVVEFVLYDESAFAGSRGEHCIRGALPPAPAIPALEEDP